MSEHIFFIQDLALLLLAAMFFGVVCKRLGLSAVAGYLLAGIALGASRGELSPLRDCETIETLSQLGMVFLMFSIGLEFSLKRLRKLGLSVLLTTFVSAGLVFLIVNFVTGLLGFPQAERVFLGAMLMICSSAIVSKILESAGIANEPSARVAMGMALCEDIVAIVMLTLLGSYAQIDKSASGTPLLQTLGLLAGFVGLLIVFGLFFVPVVLRWIKKYGTPELETLFVAGILFGLAILAQKLGYSMALGAFLIGTVFAETKRRIPIARAFDGLKDVFSAIFFCAIGMLIDLGEVPAVWPMILGVSALALTARFVAASTALMLFGNRPDLAMRAGLIILPLGEFSFIIAGVGIAANLIPPSFNTVAVGASLLTSLVAPLIVRSRGRLVGAFQRIPTPVLSQALSMYQKSLNYLRLHAEHNALFSHLRPRLVQIAIQILLVSTLVIFSRKFAMFAFGLAHRAHLTHEDWVGWGAWLLLFGLALPIFYALLRNLVSVGNTLAEFFGKITHLGRRASVFVGTLLKTLSVCMVCLWFWGLVPHTRESAYFGYVFLAAIAATLFFMRRKFVAWYGDVQANLETRLADEPARYGVLERGAQGLGWNLCVEEITLPDNAAHAGKTLAELDLRGRFGCAVAGVERHGFTFENPTRDCRVYPQDKLLLLASPENFVRTRDFLNLEKREEDARTLNDLGLETFVVPHDAPFAGKTLGELQLPKVVGVQVVGVAKRERRILNPRADVTLDGGDEAVLLGTREQLEAFHTWVRACVAPAQSQSRA